MKELTINTTELILGSVNTGMSFGNKFEQTKAKSNVTASSNTGMSFGGKFKFVQVPEKNE